MPQESQTQAGGGGQKEAEPTILAELGLGPAEVAALKRQGFVSSEIRGQGEIVYKLRFRQDRRQRVKYLGADRDRALRLEQALRELQQCRRKALALGRLNREAAKLLRDGKRRVQPLLNSAGYRFHGRAIRRPRGPHVARI